MTFLISEISSNHNNDLKRCLELIKISATIGCNAVKFQLFKIDELFAPEILKKSSKHRERKKWELQVDYIPELKSYCDNCGVEFGCTPFYLEAVEILTPYVSFFKIASYELLWDDLLEACAKTGKPIILSTGMATIDEIDHAVDVIKQSGCSDFTILHCVSSYPTHQNECNLSVIGNLRERYKVKIGWSDHSVDPQVIRRAVHRWKADCVEFHIDLDSKGVEYESGHCWLPEKISPLIEELNAAKILDGNPKKLIAESEKLERDWRADPSDGLRPLKHLRNTGPIENS